MYDNRAMLRMVLVMSAVVFVVVTVSTMLLYQVGVERAKLHLLHVVQSQVSLLEAVGEFDVQFSGEDFPGGASAATLSQLKNAYEKHEGIGNSGDFLVGKRNGDQITFLLSFQGYIPKDIAWDGELGMPMRRALQGETGTMRGPDYRGTEVLAAYSPVKVLGLGVVVKIDLAEVREPYIEAVAIALLMTGLLVLLGSILLVRLGSPFVEKIKQQNLSLHQNQQRLAKAQEIAHLGNWEWDISKNTLWWSDEIYRIFGCEPQKFDATYDAFVGFIHPDDIEKVQATVSDALKDPNVNYELEHRVVRPDGEVRIVQETGDVVRDQSGTPIHMVGIVHDVTETKLIENELKDSEGRLRSFLDSTGEAIYGIDTSGCCVLVNAACVKLLGYSSASELYGKNMHALIHHHRKDGSHYPVSDCHIFQGFMAGRSVHIDDEVFWRADGTSFPVEYRSQPVVKDGVLAGVVVSFSDISERVKAEEQQRLASSVFHSSSEGIIITNHLGEIIDVNDAFEDITGYSRREVLGKKPSMMQSGRHTPEFFRQMWRKLNKAGAWSGEIWDKRKDGVIYPKRLSINAVRDESGCATHYVGVFSDISHIKQTEVQLQKMAYYDSLTGLPNRVMSKDRLEHDIKIAQREKAKIAVLFLDLDRFKYVNDTLGHTCGDVLLVEAAKRIGSCIRESDTVARLGGDEFMVVLNNVKDIKSVERISSNIINAIADRFDIKDNQVNIGVSIGIALYPDNGRSYDELIKNADAAMYKAKEAGRNTFSYFTDELQQAMASRILMENSLREALANEGLQVYYQPKVNAHNTELVGMEALVRWPSDDGGMISPAEFIPLAEETGLIELLDEWVMYEACKQVAEWNFVTHSRLIVSVNISGRQFERENFAEKVQAVLCATGLDSNCLELEITESVMMADQERVIEILNQLRALGVSIAVDDFGTGYSSLSYLKRLPIQNVKIDKTFVSDLGKDADDEAIVSAIISMADTLDLGVVAEGVETHEQLNFLRREGCGQVQGYLLGYPMPAKRFAELLDGYCELPAKASRLTA